MSDAINAKADRYLTEGRVVVRQASAKGAKFSVYGSQPEPYTVVFAGDWACTCEARVTSCAHVRACQKVTKFDVARLMSFSDDDDELTKLLEGVD